MKRTSATVTRVPPSTGSMRQKGNRDQTRNPWMPGDCRRASATTGSWSFFSSGSGSYRTLVGHQSNAPVS
jgi:hypothetical protein